MSFYIELSQLIWLKHLCTQNKYFKSSKCNQMTIDECLTMAKNLLNSHECSKTGNKKCKCVDFQIVKFLNGLYEIFYIHGLHRVQMCGSIKNLILSRLKMENNENMLTDAQNLHIWSAQLDTRYLLSMLEAVYEYLSDIKPDTADLYLLKYASLRKQLYASIELLANFFGFFCVPIRKIDCLNLKLNYLKREPNIVLPIDPHTNNTSDLPVLPSESCAGITINLSSSDGTFQSSLANTILNLMESYLNLHQFKQMNDLNEFLVQKTVDKCASDGDYNGEINMIEKNKIFANKQEFIVTYYLIIAHYFLLKQNINDAVLIIKNKISTSTVLCGQPTASHYEAKYYLKYLLFILSTINCKFY